MSTGQTRTHSAYEAFANIVAGLAIQLTANALIFPHFGWHITVGENLALGAFYTLMSLARSYLLRRAFNRVHVWRARGHGGK